MVARLFASLVIVFLTGAPAAGRAQTEPAQPAPISAPAASGPSLAAVVIGVAAAAVIYDAVAGWRLFGPPYRFIYNWLYPPVDTAAIILAARARMAVTVAGTVAPLLMMLRDRSAQ